MLRPTSPRNELSVSRHASNNHYDKSTKQRSNQQFDQGKQASKHRRNQQQLPDDESIFSRSIFDLIFEVADIASRKLIEF